MDGQVRQVATHEATHLGPGCATSFGEGSHGVRSPATWVFHDPFEDCKVSEFIAHAQWISSVAAVPFTALELSAPGTLRQHFRDDRPRLSVARMAG